MRRCFGGEQSRGAADLSRIDDHARRLVERLQRRLDERHVGRVGDVRDAGAEPPQRAAQHRGAGRAVGLGHVRLHGEAGDDQDAARSAQRPRGAERCAGIRERGDVAMAGIEGENLVDKVDHRLASYSKHW